jgi:hypothetical protein
LKRPLKKWIVVLFWLFIVINPLFGQIKHSHNIALGFLQLKDQLNLGMVFNGAQLEYRYGLLWKIHEHEIFYQPKLGAGIGFKRGMKGYQIHIDPANVTWTMPFYEQNGHTIRGGANFAADYNYQFFDDLHDGPLFWTSEIGLSPVIRYSYQWDNKRINAELHNSLIGFTSHVQGYDPYFWCFTAKDFFVKPHEDLRFGSFNNYDHSKVSIEFVPNISGIHSFAYEFDYLGYFYGNKFGRINHNVLWRMSL